MAWYDNLPRVERIGKGTIKCCIDGVCYAPGERWHGTPGGSTNHACRCEPCVSAWATYHLSYMRANPSQYEKSNRRRVVIAGIQQWEAVPSESKPRDWRRTRWHWRGQVSGQNWFTKTYQLEYRVRSPGDTPDTGWYLYGPDGVPFGLFMERTLQAALRRANTFVDRRTPRCPGCGSYWLQGARHDDGCRVEGKGA